MFDSFVIFGGSGFVGTHMQRLLREKYPQAKVYVADLLADGSEYSPKVDVRNSIEMQGTFGPNTLVFNFAAVHRTPGHPDYAYFETNIRGAENVCAFADKHGIENIVFTPIFFISFSKNIPSWLFPTVLIKVTSSCQLPNR